MICVCLMISLCKSIEIYENESISNENKTMNKSNHR